MYRLMDVHACEQKRHMKKVYNTHPQRSEVTGIGLCLTNTCEAATILSLLLKSQECWSKPVAKYLHCSAPTTQGLKTSRTKSYTCILHVVLDAW